jgi:tRNA A22 N-methylase
VTIRRVRQIVSEALQRRQVDGGSDHAMLQLARLEQALRLAAEAVVQGEIGGFKLLDVSYWSR